MIVLGHLRLGFIGNQPLATMECTREIREVETAPVDEFPVVRFPSTLVLPRTPNVLSRDISLSCNKPGVLPS
jgi:hypothetical protein